MSWLASLKQYRAIAVIRSPDLELGLHLAQAAAAGGIGSIEITWNSDRPEQLIDRLRQGLPHCSIGAGTLLTVQHLQDAIAAGAQFLFSPHVDPDLIDAAVRSDVPIVPGALSPTEILRAWQGGAACVKVFPIQAVGGAAYIRALQGPLGHIPLIPTGGVTLDNAPAFIQAGAAGIGLSSQLFPSPLVAAKDWEAIAQRAKQVMEAIECDRAPGKCLN